MPTVYFETFGCQMNVADSNMIAALLSYRGFIETSDPQNADLIIVNTCSVRERAEVRAKRRLIELTKKTKANGCRPCIWVVGCMAQRMGEELKKEIPEISEVIGAKSIERIEQEIDSRLGCWNNLTPCSSAENKNQISVFVPVSRGCNNYCTYCIVPYVRGAEHSIAAGVILESVAALACRGVKEVTLLGQNVNSYKDGSTDFAALLQKVSQIAGIERIRFVTSHPKDCSERLIETVAGLPKCCKHIHLPLQSGSSKILELMNRCYSREHYINLIETIRRYMPQADITTDAMVGFPSETEADFLQTYTLFEAVRFTSAFMFAFSARAGTKASSMDQQVPREVAIGRLKRLIELQTQITKQHYNSMVGSIQQVLVDSVCNKDEKLWMAQNYGAKKVLVPCEENIAGCIFNVKIAKSTGMTLLAERPQL